MTLTDVLFRDLSTSVRTVALLLPAYQPKNVAKLNSYDFAERINKLKTFVRAWYGAGDVFCR
jgi:hypothetical protein